jgi:hypothetical protein
MSYITFKQLFILAFAGTYALLVWVRWYEIRQLGREDI